MAQKKPTAQQQKEKREKIILAVLVVVLVVVGAIQGPKLMGGSKGASSTPPASTTAAGTASLTATPVAAAPAGGSQLTRLGTFSAKDPFKTQVKMTAPGATPAAATPNATVSKSSVTKAKKGVSPVTLAVTPAPKNLVPEGPQVPAALLLVNGKKTVVPLNGTFPKKSPLFQLVSISPKEIELKLIGGSLTGGDTTFKLLKGHPLRLVNQTAGTRFVLAMVKPTTAPKPQPTTTTPAPATTAPAATTPTSTTPVIPPTTTTG